MPSLLLLSALACCLLLLTEARVVGIHATHQSSASTCAATGARMPSSNFPADVDDVVSFFEGNPSLLDTKRGETAFAWAYERRGNLCKVIAICGSSDADCEPRIRVANCDQRLLTVCLNVPSE